MNETNILANLNEKQQQVVSAPLSHLAVIAGAGSGKTRVLVHRIAWLIEKGHVSANRILAVTFTNKAASELRARVENLTHLSIRSMWLGTFHGLAHRFLRLHFQQADLPATFQILDSDDQYRLIKKVHTALNLDNDKWPPNQSQWYINNKKDEGIRPPQILAESHFDKILQRVYENYEEQCQRSGLVDFAELLLRSYEVLLKDLNLQQHYQDRFAHILVDEFQDTNAIQYAWLKLLAGKQANLMIVGDDDQSIYSWRGAQIENIYKFNREFQAEIIRLEQNYRSTKTILSAANSVIANNNNRYGKNLWTEGQEGDLVSVYMAFNEIDEARFIVSQIKNWREEGTSLQEIAILYRSNAQSRVLEEELLTASIPYRIYGGLKFFERAEIKDALAYLRLLANPFDDGAFERAVNMPPRGIGNTTLAAVREHARMTNQTLWQTSEQMVHEGKLTARANQALGGFLRLIQRFQQETGDLTIAMQTKYVIDQSGLYEHYSKDRSDKTQSRLENLTELIQATQQFRAEDAFALPPLQSFLSYVALESGENQAEQYEDSVQLMTLHSAKGLEFEIVFLSGMEEGLFPHKMSMEEPGRLEEERRLCYVGMTRARKKLYLTYAEARRINGSQTYRYPSRFINEIPSDLIQEVRIRPKVMRPVQFSTTSIIPHDTGIDFQLGERVSHRSFGEGVVMNYEGQGPQARIQVKFRKAGIKWLVLEFAKLEKLA
ncbi:MAG: DNA helicase II [Gammaproteobacteria bacterium]|nr:DNA helicase II [Gammaproteobacteria bacterium]